MEVQVHIQDIWVNSAPYFENWESLMPIELTEGDPDEYVFIMPEAYDDDFEAVQISVQICTINQFAKWNPAEKTVTFVLVDGVSTGLHRAAVTLDDGSLTTEY